MTVSNDVLADDLNTLNQLYELQNILTQLQKNIILIQEGAQGKQIVVNGGNLFQLAAQYYGDATRWTTIAEANNLNDPELPPGTDITLVIPISSTDDGGIYQS